MAAIGIHASHEQIAPSALLTAMREAEAAGFRRAWSSDHFSPWSERQGESGFAWAWLGAAHAGDRDALRRRQRARAALPPGDRGAGGRHAGRDVPGPAVRRARHRRVLQRAHHRGAVAAQGGAQRAAARVRGRDPRAVRRRGGRPPRPRHRRPGEAVDPSGRAAAAAGDRGERRDGRLRRRVGGRADHHQPAPRDARAPARRVPRARRRGKAGRRAGARVVGRDARRRHCASRTTSGARTSSRRRCAGTSRRSRSSTSRPPTCAPRTCAGRCWSPRTSRGTSPGSRSSRRSGSTPCTCTTSGRSSGGSSTRSASTSSRRYERQGDQRPVVEERGRLLPRRRDVPGLRRRRLRRPHGPDRPAGLPRRPRRQLPVADAVLPEPPARRRLRHHRLLRDRRPPRHARRLRGDDPHGGRPGHPRDRRPRRQPHLRPAPLVPGGPRPRLARTTTSTCGPTRSRAEKPGDVVFPDEEDSNWAYDPKARQWYLHRFYSHQPDLNVANPAVRDEIAQVVGYWLAQGLAGFRVDAVPFLLEPIGMPEGAFSDPHDFLRDLRRFMGRRRGDAILMGEVNLPPDQLRAFFGDEDGDELHMVLSFVVNQAMYLALARGDATPVREALESLPADPRGLPVGQLRPQPRRADARQALRRRAGRGVRRVRAGARTCSSTGAACAAGCRRWSAATSGGCACSTASRSRCPARRCCSTARRSGWPRTSRSPGRYSVRAPMQWSSERNGGFSTAEDAGALCRPVVDADGWSPQRVNVAAQRRSDGSLLNWMERLIRRRRECPELGWGRCTLLDAGDAAVFAHRADWEGSTILAAALVRRRAAGGARSLWSRASRRPSTCSATGTWPPDADGSAERAAGPLRLPLVPPAPRRAARGALSRAQPCRPHSVLPEPAQRPSRPAPGLVQCVQPIEE